MGLLSTFLVSITTQTNFNMFPFSTGLGDVFSLLIQHIVLWLLFESISILDHFTSIKNDYWLYYLYKPKKKKHKTEILIWNYYRIYSYWSCENDNLYRWCYKILGGILWLQPNHELSVQTFLHIFNLAVQINYAKFLFYNLYDCK